MKIALREQIKERTGKWTVTANNATLCRIRVGAKQVGVTIMFGFKLGLQF